MTVTNMKSFQALALEAREGSQDAANALARQAPNKSFLSFLATWVQPGDMTVEIFDRFSDAYHRMEMEREAKAT